MASLTFVVPSPGAYAMPPVMIIARIVLSTNSGFFIAFSYGKIVAAGPAAVRVLCRPDTRPGFQPARPPVGWALWETVLDYGRPAASSTPRRTALHPAVGCVPRSRMSKGRWGIWGWERRLLVTGQG